MLGITGSMLAEEPLETATSFDALPDEVLHLVGQYLWAGEKRLCDALSFFECSSRHRALLSGLSELVLHGGGRDTEGVLSCHASLMAPQSWAVRLAALRAVEVSGFGFGSVGRLLMLLPLWPLLEQLEIRMPTGDAAGWLHLQQLDELTKDLVFLSRSGAVRLSRFHYVWLGSEKVDGTMIRYNGATQQLVTHAAARTDRGALVHGGADSSAPTHTCKNGIAHLRRART